MYGLFFHYNVKYYKPIFNEITNEIDIENKIQYHDEKFNIKNNLELKNISFKYDKSKIEENFLNIINQSSLIIYLKRS